MRGAEAENENGFRPSPKSEKEKAVGKQTPSANSAEARKQSIKPAGTRASLESVKVKIN